MGSRNSEDDENPNHPDPTSMKITNIRAVSVDMPAHSTQNKTTPPFLGERKRKSLTRCRATQKSSDTVASGCPRVGAGSGARLHWRTERKDTEVPETAASLPRSSRITSPRN